VANILRWNANTITPKMGVGPDGNI